MENKCKWTELGIKNEGREENDLSEMEVQKLVGIWVLFRQVCSDDSTQVPS